MASVRLRAANVVLKNLTKVHINSNVYVTIHRRNHALFGSQAYFMKRTSPSTMMRNVDPFRINFRLEHAVLKDTGVVDSEKVVPTQTVASAKETLKSNEVPPEVKNVETNNSNALNSSFDESLLPEIPDAPGLSTFIAEPTLHSLGLCGWSPPGIVQQILEFFHVNLNMPWWACIVSFTIIMRGLLFPLAVKAKRDTVTFQNNVPYLQKLQNDMSAARKSGNYYEAARTSQELTQFLQEKHVSPAGMFLTILVQAPVFITVYLALRKMAEIPDFVSFQTGGLLWFTDLSVPDQFYILPLLTSVTLWATIKFGIVMQTVPTQLGVLSRTRAIYLVEYGIPAFVFVFTMNFPSAILCYWTATNFFVLLQTMLFNVKPLKKFFGIPNAIPPPAVLTDSVTKKMGIIEGFKESYMNMKITREIEHREYLNAVKFEESGNKPSKRTFKFDPTKVAKKK